MLIHWPGLGAAATVDLKHWRRWWVIDGEEGLNTELESSITTAEVDIS